MSTRPRPYSPKRIETFYMDFQTGRGVTDSGATFTSRVSPGRKNPTLEDKLETVAALANQTQEAATIIFTGKVPKVEPGDLAPGEDAKSRHWLLVRTGAWESVGHWLGTPPTGRFEHRNTRKYIEVRTAAEWFGSAALTPPQAREAFMVLEQILANRFRSYLPEGMSTVLMKTPAATGMNLWAAALPKQIELLPCTDDIAEELHATSGQHHLEHTVAGPSMDRHEDVLPLVDPNVLPKLDGFAYIDGRFMYASLCNRLGIGPGIRLKRSEAADLLLEKPYARARYRIRFTVPPGWRNVGIFGVQHHNARQGWYYPNRPGATGETWCDGAEIFVAQKFGWLVDPLEAVLFNDKMPAERKRFREGDAVARRTMTESKPLDTWAKKLTEARQMVAEDPELPQGLKTALGGALRAILIQSIGKFASRGRGSTKVTYDPKAIPPEYADSVVRQGQAYTYLVPQKMTAQQQLYYRPEFAVQVWGRGRAKVLHNVTNGQECGALTLPANSILGINGDAVYTSHLPRWSLPTDQGGADDGKAGRLRLQGYLPGPIKTPVTRSERDKLRDQANKAGVNVTPELLMDQATFDFEFTYQNDDAAAYAEEE
ncbi:MULTISPECIES: hypothetical protein [unclassified Arthrobacter]|uniref:hypothetical protein n=1 Tax=unclassified Arthrobacter TaxID=235627 RepID=UPI0015E212BE|nr:MULTISPECIES: hypothetical protein [unclassified Arthrobacter]